MLDLEGVRLVDAQQPADLAWGNGPRIADLLTSFLKAEGRVVVCPHCAHSAGLSPKDVVSGVQISSEGALARAILDADKVVDY